MPSFRTIFKTALLVGTLDIAAAFIQFYSQTGKTPFKPVLSFIASGLVGKDSGLSEIAMILLGLLLHFFIATAFVLFFFLTVAKWQVTKQHWLLIGILYGIFVWAVMGIIVLPIAFSRAFVFNLSKNALAAGILIVCIGIPLAYITARKTSKVHKQNITIS